MSGNACTARGQGMVVGQSMTCNLQSNTKASEVDPSVQIGLQDAA